MADLDTPDQADLRAMVRDVLAEHAEPERVRRHDEAESFDHELYDRLAGLGLVAFDSTVDGVTTDPGHQAVVLEELGATATSLAVCFVVQYMGVQLLGGLGTEDQRKAVLQPLLDGTQRVAFALTEPDGGIDVARAMRTRATKTVNGWSLSGTKTWISGPKVASHLIVVARTGAAAPSAVDGITLFLVPTGHRGVEIRELDTIGIHGLDTCEISFTDVQLSHGDVLGPVHQGFRALLSTLNRERLNAAAVAVGIARGALELAVRYAQERQAFGRPLGAFQALQHRLVDVAIAVESARGLLSRATRAPELESLSAMAKVAASDAAVRATDEGMRVLAGAGFSREFAMQRYFRDARLYTFAPFSDDMMRNYLGERLLEFPRSY